MQSLLYGNKLSQKETQMCKFICLKSQGGILYIYRASCFHARHTANATRCTIHHQNQPLLSIFKPNNLCFLASELSKGIRVKSRKHLEKIEFSCALIDPIFSSSFHSQSFLFNQLLYLKAPFLL